MALPPLPAVLVGGGLIWNLVRSQRNKRPGVEKRTTISRWACAHKRAAVTVAGGFSAWWLIHWALYVIEEG